VTESPLTEAQLLHYDDLTRRGGRRADLLTLLLDKQWHTNGECLQVGGLSFNDSIYSFRQDQWDIESRRIRGGIWEFRLRGKTKEVAGHKPMTRPQGVVAKEYVNAISELYGAHAVARITAHLDQWLRVDDDWNWTCRPPDDHLPSN
jgi:hypothetical protein